MHSIATLRVISSLGRKALADEKQSVQAAGKSVIIHQSGAVTTKKSREIIPLYAGNVPLALFAVGHNLCTQSAPWACSNRDGVQSTMCGPEKDLPFHNIIPCSKGGPPYAG
jgi:hypothetical protein